MNLREVFTHSLRALVSSIQYTSVLTPLSLCRQAVRRGPEPGPGHGARAVRQRAVPRAEQAHPQKVQRAQGRGDRLQARASNEG